MDKEATKSRSDFSTDLLPSGGEVRGSVLDVVTALRADNDWDAVMAVNGGRFPS